MAFKNIWNDGDNATFKLKYNSPKEVEKTNKAKDKTWNETRYSIELLESKSALVPIPSNDDFGWFMDLGWAGASLVENSSPKKYDTYYIEKIGKSFLVEKLGSDGEWHRIVEGTSKPAPVPSGTTSQKPQESRSERTPVTSKDVYDNHSAVALARRHTAAVIATALRASSMVMLPLLVDREEITSVCMDLKGLNVDQLHKERDIAMQATKPPPNVIAAIEVCREWFDNLGISTIHAEVKKLIGSDPLGFSYNDLKKQFPNEDIMRILEELVNDGEIVQNNKELFHIAEEA